MLASLSRSLLAPQHDSQGLDMTALRVVLPVPELLSWDSVLNLCECGKGLYSILEQDVEHVAQVLAALEMDAEQLDNPPTPKDPLPEKSAPIPSIIITPPLHPPSTSSLLPYQDSAFHTRLTVPTPTRGHAPFNQNYPPMLRLVPVPARAVSRWTWTNGHWQALIAGMEAPRPRKLKRKTRTKNKNTSKNSKKSRKFTPAQAKSDRP
ncbi:hypothetical protein FB45DRAFT_1037894 [Roridomyces roridus]|uniref:Uncharacterized protein n=1 Tax=Roridomyces roridus TaxID=1738132 RepID=A0AAD7FBW6_9AGAR|nr:hypothetical protein FB45DRAFT_1037894 [Roridomyces roridus]